MLEHFTFRPFPAEFVDLTGFKGCKTKQTCSNNSNLVTMSNAIAEDVQAGKYHVKRPLVRKL
jgi:hypothetical protein